MTDRCLPDNTSGGPRLLEARFVALEPALDGFLGVMVELYERPAQPEEPEPYFVRQTAAGSGNVVLSASCSEEERAYEIFHRMCETGVPWKEPFDSPESPAGRPPGGRS